MAKSVAVLVTNLVEDVEYTEPVEALKSAGHKVTTISFEKALLKVSMVLRLTLINPLMK